MSHRVDALVHAVQASGEHASPGRIVTYSHAPHLGNGDCSMLSLGEPGDQRVGCGDFSVL